MVCLGNICRSPMAEGILRHQAQERNIAVQTDSCGTSSWHQGEGADERAVDNLARKGIDISDLRSRPFRDSDFEDFDLIYCMDGSNLMEIESRADSNEQLQGVKLILNEVSPGQDSPVPDPYYGGEDGFEHVYNLLNEACSVILDKIEENKL